MSGARADEAVVIGGGLAGGAVATLLAQGGRRVHLIEREREPVDKICGEFLSIEAQRTLARLGLDLDRLGAAPISTLRLGWGTRTIELPLPFVARGLTRRRLDAVLLDHAAASGARIDRGVAVRAIAGGRVETNAGTLSPALTLLASGKHEVRGAPRTVAGCHTGYVGFKMYWRLSPAARAKLTGIVAVTLFEGGYAGLQLVENGIANLCLLVDRATFASLGASWSTLLRMLVAEPGLAPFLDDAEALLPKPLTIAGVPYGFLQRGSPPDALFRMGDQAAVIPSFCGEGMAIALRTATLAASIIAGGGDANDHRRRLGGELAGRLRLAMALQRRGQRTWSRHILWAGLRAAPSLGKALVQLTRVPQ